MNASTTPPINRKKVQSINEEFKVISDSTRLSVLFLLQKEELGVGNIVLTLGMGQPTASHQLKILDDLRLVKVGRGGKSMTHNLGGLHIFSIPGQILTHVKEQGQ